MKFSDGQVICHKASGDLAVVIESDEQRGTYVLSYGGINTSSAWSSQQTEVGQKFVESCFVTKGSTPAAPAAPLADAGHEATLEIRLLDDRFSPALCKVLTKAGELADAQGQSEVGVDQVVQAIFGTHYVDFSVNPMTIRVSPKVDDANTEKADG